MEVLVYEDAREVEVDLAVEDEPLKRKRRVSFAQTQTVHFYPCNDDIETPPLLTDDLVGPPASASKLATPKVSSEQQSSTPRVSEDLLLQENSMNLSHFTSDMDTSHGSWAADEDIPGVSPSFDGLDDDSGCFVHLRHISHAEEDDSIVNEVFSDDVTMDATMFSRNLSQYLKSGTTFDLQGTDYLTQNTTVLINEDTRSEDSMALTKTGAPHWGLNTVQNVCLDVSLHADDEKSDMSLATSDRVRPKTIHTDDEKSDMSLTTMSDGPKTNFIHGNGDKSGLKLDTEINKKRPKKRRSLTENLATPLKRAECTSLQNYIHLSNKEKENRAPQKLQDVTLKLEQKVTSYIKDDHVEEKCMVRIPLRAMQTLRDYLEFSCSVQLQVEWLSEHIQDLECKLKDAKKRNAEIKCKNTSSQVEKDTEVSSYALKPKTASYTYSLAKKGWLSWKLDAQRQILCWLQQSKDNLMKEVNEAQTKSKQVLQLKESYSCIYANMGLDQASGHFNKIAPSPAPAKIIAKLLTVRQEACDQLSRLQTKWDEVCTKIQHIMSLHNQRHITQNDKELFESALKDSIRKLAFTNSLLQQLQAMHLNVGNSRENSVLDLSLGEMYLQSFQFKGDSPSTQVLIARSLFTETIEMRFPCMEAPLLIQHVIFSTNFETVELQRLHYTIQRSNLLVGSMLDVLKEVNFCRRNFAISCKFEIVNDGPCLRVAFLQCQNGKRVTLEFSMARLCRGMYPFNEDRIDIQIETFDSKVAEMRRKNDVAGRISKIRNGFGRLARICVCMEGLL